MVTNYMTQDDVIDELKERTGFYKNNLRDVFDALDDIIVEHMNKATVEEPSEMIIFKSWRLGGKRLPERESKDPRDGSKIMTKEKVVPYCKFKQSFKDRLNRFEPNVEIEDEGDVDE